MYKETRIENKDWYQVAGNCRKMKNRVSKNGGKSAKSRRDTTPFLMDLLVAFPGKNTAKQGRGTRNGAQISPERTGNFGLAEILAREPSTCGYKGKFDGEIVWLRAEFLQFLRFHSRI
jgi:hypothetical protein